MRDGNRRYATAAPAGTYLGHGQDADGIVLEGYGVCGIQIKGSISELRHYFGLEQRHESNAATPWLTRDANDRKDESRLAQRITTPQQ